MSEQFTGFNPNQPDNKSEMHEPFTSGFTGDVFEPKKLWGEESPLALYMLNRPLTHKTCVAVHDYLSIQAGWGEAVNSGYAPVYYSVSDKENFAKLYDISMSERDIQRLYPFTKRYTAILPVLIDKSPLEFYLENHTEEEVARDQGADGSLPIINYLFERFNLGKEDIHPEKIFKVNNNPEYSRLQVFTTRLIQERMNGKLLNIEEFVGNLSETFGEDMFRILSDLHSEILPLVSKRGLEQISPAVFKEKDDKSKFFRAVSELMAETALLQIKYSPENTEHTFFPFYTDNKERWSPLEFYPYLMESFAVFCANIPEYVPEGKSYTPDRVTADVRNLYNYFFKLLGKEQELAFKKEDSLKDNAFSKRCEFVRRKLLETYQSSTYTGNREAALANVNKLFGAIQERTMYVEAVIDMPLQKLARFNKTEGRKSSYLPIPTIGERLHAIRSQGRKISGIRAAWALLSGDPRDY